MTTLSNAEVEKLAERLREGATHIDNDGTPSQVGPDAETLRQAARYIQTASAVIAAAMEFRENGTTLTMCSRGPCQRVVERKDNSDPQAKLYAALRAHDASNPREG